MAKVVQIAGESLNTKGFGFTGYFLMSNAFLEVNSMRTTETDVQITYQSAGTLSNLRCYVATNTFDGATTIITRKNVADGAQSISIGAAATGAFEDTTNTDTIAAGDEVCGKFVTTASSSGAISVKTIQTCFAATADTVCHHAVNSASGISTASATLYYGLAGTFSADNTTLANAEFTPGTGGTLQKLFVDIAINGRGTATTFATMIAGSAGTLTVSVGASATGIFEDTSNTDAFFTGNKLAFRIVTGTGTGSIFPVVTAVELKTTNNKWVSIFSRPQAAIDFSANLTRYVPIGGAFTTPETTEAPTQTKASVACNASYLHCYVSANTCSIGTSIFRFRKNAADTALTISIGALATGVFTDTSNTVALVDTDLVSIKVLAAGDEETLSLRNWGLTFENTEAVAGGVILVDMDAQMRDLRGGMRG